MANYRIPFIRNDFDYLETHAEMIEREHRATEAMERLSRDTFDGWTIIDTTPGLFDPFNQD